MTSNTNLGVYEDPPLNSAGLVHFTLVYFALGSIIYVQDVDKHKNKPVHFV